MPRAFSGWCAFSPLNRPPEAVCVRVARIDPIPFRVKNDATGLGKTSQDFRMIETTVSQRRELDSERQRNETEEQRKAREASVFVSLSYMNHSLLLCDHREMLPVARLSRPRYRRSFGRFTAPSARNNSKTSPSTMNTPTRTRTTTKFVSARCKMPSGPSRTLPRSRTDARKRNGSAKRRSCVRSPPRLA